VASSGVSSSLARLLRLVSWIICLIVVASFVAFVVDQTSAASTHQQEELNGGRPPGANTPGAAGTSKTSKHESELHEKIDEAANVFTSPFADIISGSSSQWAIHGVKTALALLIYGFGLGYLARVLRVRV
jgi:hypothetical protein